MKATAWNNGHHHKTGAGYGLKISSENRDANFKRSSKSIDLYLPNSDQPININIDKQSFWGSTCRELIHREIGKWLLESGIAPWEKGQPPNFELNHVEGRVFQIVM